MITQYAILIRNTLTRTPIAFDDLFDGRLERWDVTADKPHRALFDCSGRWVSFDSESGSMVDGFWHSVTFCRDVPTNSIERNSRPQAILDAISREFNVDVYSEHEPQYWGFDTMEEVEQAMAVLHRRLDELEADGAYGLG